MGDQYSEVAVKLGQYIAPALDREITDEDYPLFDLLLDFAKDKIFAQGYPSATDRTSCPCSISRCRYALQRNCTTTSAQTDRRATLTMALLVCGKAPMWRNPC